MRDNFEIFGLEYETNSTKLAAKLTAKHSKGQGNKSKGWKPWHQEPMKDVISCEKLRGGANSRRAVDIRMGQPS